MKINFILPTFEFCGGIKVVAEYADRLQQRGHEVTVIYPEIQIAFDWPCRQWYDPVRFAYYLLHLLGKTRRNAALCERGDWFTLNARLLKVPSLLQENIPDADIVVATLWATAYYVCRYPESKGRKFYLIQHYETWCGKKSRVEKTYAMGLSNIVISTWLKEKVEKSGGYVSAIIPDGIDFQEFYPDPGRREDERVRVLIPYRYESWKGTEDGLQAFMKARQRNPGIQLVMFGPNPGKNALPKEVEFHIIPTKAALRRLYNSCDIFLFPSWHEGFGLPPFEAMACKRAVVATRVGALLDYAVDGQTALLSDPHDVDALAENILRLAKDKQEREKIAENGYNSVRQLSWENSVDKIEKVFRGENIL